MVYYLKLALVLVLAGAFVLLLLKLREVPREERRGWAFACAGAGLLALGSLVGAFGIDDLTAVHGVMPLGGTWTFLEVVIGYFGGIALLVFGLRNIRRAENLDVSVGPDVELPDSSGNLPALLVLVFGLIISAGSYFFLYHSEKEKESRRFSIRSQDIGSAVGSAIGQFDATVSSIASFLRASPHVDQEAFNIFAKGLLTRYHGIQALEWIPRVPAAQKAEFEASQRRQGAAPFRILQRNDEGAMVAALGRDSYYPVTFVEPLAGNERAVGFDLGSNASRRAALEKARDSGLPVATERITLVQETSSQYGFLLFVPVYETGSVPDSVEGRRRLLTGFALGVFRLGDMLSSVLAPELLSHLAAGAGISAMEGMGQGGGDALAEGRAYQAYLVDLSAPEEKRLLHFVPAAGEERSEQSDMPSVLGGEHTDTHYGIGGRQWQMVLIPLNRGLSHDTVILPTAVAALALLATLLLTLYLAEQRDKTREVERLVAMRSNDLKKAYTDLQEQMGQRELAENRLLQKQRLESIGELTGGIAHEFNNLLMVIDGSITRAIDFLRQKVPDAALGPLETAMESTDKAASLTGRLLVFSSRKMVETRVLRLSRLLAETRDLISSSLGELFEIDLQVEDGSAFLQTDQSQFTQSILNLALNARDAMPIGGTIKIRARTVELDDEFVASHGQMKAGKFAEISVIDEGAGIGEEDLEKVFDPFFTTKDQGSGTGLGLSVVYGFARQNNGTSTVESEPGSGTTVRIYLPLTAKAEEEVELNEIDETDVQPGKGETILVVEDNAPLLGLMNDRLTELGYNILTASDGFEALEVEASHANGIDLLLTDVVMPSMGGIEVAHILRETHSDLKVLFISGHTDRHSMNDAAIPESAVFLQKPVKLDKLARIVREALDDSQTATAQ